MALWDIFKRDIREFFTSNRTRSERRQCEFHLRVASSMRAGALSGDELLWREYYDELSRGVAAKPDSVEARYRRSEAALYWFQTMRPTKSDPVFRELARSWDRDLQFILTHFPDRPAPDMSLGQARQMRDDYDRICRGIRI